LLKALAQLKTRKKDFDMLLVETTGLANPAPVVATFTQNATVANNFRVDGIVCLVDCKYIKDHIDEVRADDAVNEAVCQVAFADRILLNKIDLVTKAELTTLKTTINSINAFAEQYECERSKVPLDKIMNLSAFSIERMNAAMDEFEIDDIDGSHDHGHDDSCEDESCAHEHGHSSHESEHGHHESEHGHHESEHGHHESEHGHSEKPDDDCTMCDAADDAVSHDHAEGARKKKKKHDLSGVGSVGLTADRPLISAQFNYFMSDLLRTQASNLYRSKGVLAFVEEGDAKFIFQGVHENIQYTTALHPWGADEPRVSKCVFIGRGLDFEDLRKRWQKCIEPPAEEKKGFLSAAKEALLG